MGIPAAQDSNAGSAVQYVRPMNLGYFCCTMGKARSAVRLFLKIRVATETCGLGGPACMTEGGLTGLLATGCLLLVAPDDRLEPLYLGVGLVEEVVGVGSDVVPTLLSHCARYVGGCIRSAGGGCNTGHGNGTGRLAHADMDRSDRSSNESRAIPCFSSIDRKRGLSLNFFIVNYLCGDSLRVSCLDTFFALVEHPGQKQQYDYASGDIEVSFKAECWHWGFFDS